MSRDLKKQKKQVEPANVVEFVLPEDLPSSAEFVGSAQEVEMIGDVKTLAPATKLEDMPPVFRELAQPKLPELPKENRARLLMQSPNRLFFYWSIGSNPFQKLNKALGADTASYTLVMKFIDLKRDIEKIYPVDSEGTWWFDVESDGDYQAEVGFYAPNRPFVRALFSNSITTPRQSPSPRVDTDADWAIPSNDFAQVLDVAGFTQDAFDVAIAGDDRESADVATHRAFAELVGSSDDDLHGVATEEIRQLMLLLAAGAALESLRWKVSPDLFAILQKQPIDPQKALAALQNNFEIEADELTEEEFGPAVFGASSVNFPRRLTTRRTKQEFKPISSARPTSSVAVGEKPLTDN